MNPITSCSTENLFNRFRLGVIRGEVSCKDIKFRFQGIEISLDRYGDCHPWPKGFLSLSAKMAKETMLKASQMRLDERE